MRRQLSAPCGALITVILFALTACTAPPRPAQRAAPAAELGPIPEGCTSIMVGRAASQDGSVMTSHTCDANYRTWVQIKPARKHPKGSLAKVYKGRMHGEFPSDQRGVVELGAVPQVERTYAFLDTAYPAMNEHQLAMGESTFGGKRELRSDQGIFYIEELQRLALERTTTAREAIRLMGELAETYGYIDGGEALTVADPREVWHFEIMGPGKGNKGAVWAAARIPDDHVGVAANIARIPELHLDQPDFYMASKNVFSLAQELGWWDPKGGEPFKFWKAYSGRKPFTAREYWVFTTLAPGLKLDFEAEELPFSVKPERKVSVRDLFRFFRGTYEGSRFELTRNLVVADRRSKKKVISSYVHPWMPRGLQALFNALKPGLVTFHRPIPVMYNAYNTVLQCRSWLPDPVGGICWLGFDNPATTARAPIFCGVKALPPSYAIDNQHRYRRDSAAWAYRRASRLACIHWGAHKKKMQSKILAYENKALSELPAVEQRALELLRENPEKARDYLTDYTCTFCRAMTQDYWDLGDALWMDYRFRF